MTTKIVIAGGSGFLGSALTRFYTERGYSVLILGRARDRPSANPLIRYAQWDGKTLGDWVHELEGAHAVINLAGMSVNCRYTPANKDGIMNSRVDSVRILGEAIEQSPRPPAVWVNASTATIYADSREIPNAESDGRIGNGFSVGVARAWERAFFETRCPKTRKLALRTSLALGHGDNSAYTVFARLCRFGFGGYVGDGGQMISWIHVEDFARAVDFLIESEEIDGVVNVTSPASVTNRTFMKQLRRSLDIRIGIPTPKWALAIGALALRTEPELALKSRFVTPERLMQNRFIFRYPFIDQAFEALAKEGRPFPSSEAHQGIGCIRPFLGVIGTRKRGDSLIKTAWTSALNRQGKISMGAVALAAKRFDRSRDLPRLRRARSIEARHRAICRIRSGQPSTRSRRRTQMDRLDRIVERSACSNKNDRVERIVRALR